MSTEASVEPGHDEDEDDDEEPRLLECGCDCGCEEPLGLEEDSCTGCMLKCRYGG